MPNDRVAQPPAPAALDPFVSELGRSWQCEAPELLHRTLGGTLVFADISGFTKLTERLAARGRVGAEEMSDHLDLVLSELLTAAYGFGGWLVKWGGDALLLMYDGDDHEARACAASGAMQACIRRIGLLDSSVGRVRLRMSIGAHTGRFAFHFVGSRHRELLITGDAATTTATLEATAEAGEILVSPQLAAALPPECRGGVKGPGILLARVPAADRVAGRPATAAADVAAPDVENLVPQLVLDHLRAGGGAGEHRPVTVAFLEFSGMAVLRRRRGTGAVNDGLAHLVDVTQESCHRNVVSFHETDIAADGGKFMLVAGAPRGVDNASEAMLCTLRQVFDDPGPLSVRAGVTTGRVFTGVVGPAFRRSYSVKGDVVNLAARVMGKTPAHRVWALPAVVDASRTRFAVTPVPPFMVKGKVAPVHVTEVGAALPPRAAHADLPLVGRSDEMQVLLRALDRARQGSGRHLELVAPPGAGKSRLLAELRDASAGTPVITIVAELYRAAAAYSLVRPLLLQALAVEGAADGAMAEAVQG
ncbi:MAG: adenylate/guanylate cyclase domain-containing protein, partial [Frankiales bacterium]|nr:adenylate/guanylate cyclase domain-containing protein [Frankiales bacterium]